MIEGRAACWRTRRYEKVDCSDKREPTPLWWNNLAGIHSGICFLTSDIDNDPRYSGLNIIMK